MALDYVDQLPEDKTYTNEDMCKAMDQRFGSERLATVYRAELRNRSSKSGENSISIRAGDMEIGMLGIS